VVWRCDDDDVETLKHPHNKWPKLFKRIYHQKQSRSASWFRFSHSFLSFQSLLFLTFATFLFLLPFIFLLSFFIPLFFSGDFWFLGLINGLSLLGTWSEIFFRGVVSLLFQIIFYTNFNLEWGSSDHLGPPLAMPQDTPSLSSFRT